LPGKRSIRACATQGGTLEDGSLTTLDYVNLALDNTGTISVGQITSFTDATLSLTAGSVTLSNLTDGDGANFVASGGATLSLPLLPSYTGQVGNTPSLEATGAGSTLSLAKLTSITGGDSSFGSQAIVQALAGATLDLPALTQISRGPVTLESDGTGSVVKVPDLTSFSWNLGTGFGARQNDTLQVTNSGTLQNGSPASLSHVSLTLDGTGTLSSSQITSFTYGTLPLTSGTLTLGGLTDADGSSFLVSGGASLSLPALASYTSSPGVDPTLQASETGSALSLAGLTTLTADTSNGSSRIIVNALSGGQVGLGAAS